MSGDRVFAAAVLLLVVIWLALFARLTAAPWYWVAAIWLYAISWTLRLAAPRSPEARDAAPENPR